MSQGNARQIVTSRQRTHGEWPLTASIAQKLKACLAEGIAARARPLTAAQREALDMILAKIARIVSGDPNHTDHWDDIAGYARLARGEQGGS